MGKKNGNKLNQYIVVSIYLLSLYTTMMDTNQETEIINTTKRMVRNIPINASICLLQVVYSFLLILGTTTFCANPSYFN